MRGLGLQQIVQRVAVQLGCPAGPPGLPIEANQAGFGLILVSRPARNQHRPGDERQLMIFLEEEDDAILQLDALGLLGFEVVQLGDGNLLP